MVLILPCRKKNRLPVGVDIGLMPVSISIGVVTENVISNDNSLHQYTIKAFNLKNKRFSKMK